MATSARFVHTQHPEAEKARKEGLKERGTYEVKRVMVRRYNSTFKLAGVDGWFNTCLFDISWRDTPENLREYKT